MKDLSGLSIVVCCYNDAVLLRSLLDSFLDLENPECKVELLVIDNASKDNTKEVFESYIGKFQATNFNFIYYLEEKRGLNHARNRGIVESSFEYVGFTDADAKLHPKYLINIEKTIRSVSPLIIFGPYYPWYSTPKPKWFSDKYNVYDLQRPQGFVDGNLFPCGINMIFQKERLMEIGSFTTEIVFKGEHDRGEETELFYRYKEQYKMPVIYYDPDIIVYHYTRPQAMHLSYWKKYHWVLGKNQAKYIEVKKKGKIKDYLWILLTVSKLFLKYILRFKEYRNLAFKSFLFEKILPFYYSFARVYYS